MTNLLLIPNQTIIIVVAVVLGVLCIAAGVYGGFRKFSKQSWIGWQIPAVFGLTLMLDYIPALSNPTVNFIIWVGGFIAASAFVLGIGGILRVFVFKRKKKPARGWVILDRIVGVISAPVTLLVLVVVLGGYALSAVEVFSPAVLGSFFDMPVWTAFFGKYAVDLFLISAFMLIMRAGYRMGIFRTLYALIMIALSGGSVAGAILLTTRVGFMRSFAGAVANLFAKFNPAIATVAGYGFVIGLVFIVFFVIVIVGGYFLHKLVKKLCSIEVLEVVTGIVVSIIFSAAFILIACAVNMGVAYLTQGNLSEALPEAMSGLAAQLESVGIKLAEWIQKSPLSGMLYLFNPFRALVGV